MCLLLCYIGETNRHFSTSLREHKLLFCGVLTILEFDATKFQVKIEEAMFMNSGKKSVLLNQQIHHVIVCLFFILIFLHVFLQRIPLLLFCVRIYVFYSCYVSYSR